MAAATRGFGVPAGSFSAEVAAVYRGACLMALDDGALVTLAVRELGSLPHGFSLKRARGFDFRGRLLRGMPASARGGVLRFAGSALAVDLRPARPWRSNLAGLGLTLDHAAQQGAWQAAHDELARDGRAADFAVAAGQQIAELSATARALDAGRTMAAAGRLIGLGKGSTPAGDDLLVGFLAGLWASAAAEPARSTFLSRLHGPLGEAAARTSRLSRLYLMAAAAGEVSERLTRLAAAVAAGAAEPLARARTRRALAVGHSSGASGVLGFLAASAAFSPAAMLRLGLAPYVAAASSRMPTTRQIRPSST